MPVLLFENVVFETSTTELAPNACIALLAFDIVEISEVIMDMNGYFLLNRQNKKYSREPCIAVNSPYAGLLRLCLTVINPQPKRHLPYAVGLFPAMRG